VRTGSVKQQARKFINDYVEPGDAVAVVTLGGSGNQSFTSDKARLIAAVESFIGGKSRSGTLNKLESLIRAASDLPPSDYETAIKAADARTLFDSIRLICSSFGTVPGRRRSIVLFSEGIELDITDTMGTAPKMGDDAQSASSQASTYAAELLLSQRAMFDAARKSNVSLYTIDPRGTSAGEHDLMSRISGSLSRFGLPGGSPGSSRNRRGCPWGQRAHNGRVPGNEVSVLRIADRFSTLYFRSAVGRVRAFVWRPSDAGTARGRHRDGAAPGWHRCAAEPGHFGEGWPHAWDERLWTRHRSPVDGAHARTLLVGR
jgi:hypothetical protein